MDGCFKRIGVWAAGAAAFAAATAHAMILTTWQLPENEGAITGEKATEVAVLSIRRSLDETGTVVIYRTDAPGTLAACAAAGEIVPDANRGGLSASFVENAAAGFAFVRSFGRAGGGGNYNFSATDAATNYLYEGQTSWGSSIGYGEHWGGWITPGQTEPARTFRKEDFAVSVDGVYARTFENNAKLDSGKFEVSASHEFSDKFSGFGVYGDAGEELLRWGVTTDDNGTVAWFCYALATGGQNNYQFFKNPDAHFAATADNPVNVDYALTWEAIDAGLQFQVAATWNGTTYTSGWLEVVGAQAVSAVGVLTAGGSESKFLRFDDIRVEGHVIPEPGTVSLLLLGVAVLGARRRK
jgi:hypothetical protein